MNQLQHKILQCINQHGSIDVHTFMGMALYDSDDGYYFTQNVLGKNGDYITSPEISQVFGEILGCWFIDQWYQHNKPDSFDIIELGPGRGTLMADMLRTFSKHFEFWNALQNIVLVEISPILRQTQRERLKAYQTKILHLDDLENYIPCTAKPALIIAHEFFDALPIKQFVTVNDIKTERRIIKNNSETLEFSDQNIPPIHIEEFCPSYQIIMEHITRIMNAGGSALIIDYGFEDGNECGDSLQGLHRNRYTNILSNPGSVDLSHHVNFSHLRSFVPENFHVHLSSQKDFLLTHGILERTEHLAEKAQNSQQSNHLLSATARLTMPQHMGTLFKVMQVSNRLSVGR